MAEETTSSGLFSVFILSMYSLVLIPYTIYYLCNSSNEVVQPVVKAKRKKGSKFSAALERLCTRGNLLMLLAWVAWLGMLWYTQANMQDLKPFDPFEILGLPSDATEKDIRKAYRVLSLKYHPDKNPDPKAHAYFASYITKAYQALTDDVARLNYQKYGHPDGPQGINLGIALPQWMFNKDKKTAPLMLLGLVGVGILLPLSIMSWYMLRSDQYSGPNRIHNDTLMYYLHSKFAVKESQSLVRIPETLLCAMEFITLYTPPDHTAPMEELRKLVAPAYPDIMSKDKKAFWERKASVVKAHMLLLAHLERLDEAVPQALQQDLRFVLNKAPVLLEEMLRIASLPRIQPAYGWMTPALASVEMMQCISAGLNINSRKGGGGKGGSGLAPLLALPHMDQEVVKKLRKRKISSLKELQELTEPEQTKALVEGGMSASEAEEAVAYLSALPVLAASATCEVEGEEEVMEGDPAVKCKVRVLLSRPSHSHPGYALSGKVVRAFTPHCPVPRDESWYLLLVDPSNNALLTWTKANLLEAEKEGIAHPGVFTPAPTSSSSPPGSKQQQQGGNGTTSRGASTGGYVLVEGGGTKTKEVEGSDGVAEEERGQEVVLMFPAPKAGRYDLQLHLMSDVWVGADMSLPVKLKVSALTKAVAEGRDAKTKAVAKQWSDTDSEGEEEEGSEAGSASGSGSGSEEEDYDSEETGEEESDEE